MDLPIVKRAEVDKWRNYLKNAEPYEDYENLPYDMDFDPKREQATSALILLKAYGLDPYNDNDYGDIKE